MRIARDELRRIRELTRAIDALERELAGLVADSRRSCCRARLRRADRRQADRRDRRRRALRHRRQARPHSPASAPIPASSGRTDRHRLDRGGNRQLNCALHRLAISKGRLDPDTAAYLARKQAEGKSRSEALRCLKRHLARRVWRLLQPPPPSRPIPTNAPPTISRSGTAIHCNTPYNRFALT